MCWLLTLTQGHMIMYSTKLGPTISYSIQALNQGLVFGILRGNNGILGWCDSVIGERLGVLHIGLIFHNKN